MKKTNEQIARERTELAAEIQELKQAQADSRARTEVISTKLTTRGLVDSTWNYRDSDGDEGELIFLADGKISFWNPNDSTPDNDTWEFDDKQIRISINGGYSKYVGEISPKQTSISGTAVNKLGKTWTWTAVRSKRNMAGL